MPAVALGRAVRRPLLLALVGALALLCASCAAGPQHPSASQVRHSAGPRVKTDPATSTTVPPTTTTTTAPAPKTDARTYTPPPSPPPPPAATTTTTAPPPPACNWNEFVAKVTTDQATYPSGQPVQITLVFENAGPACTVTATGYACPLVNIDNASGTLVWTNAAPASSGCPSTYTGPNVLAANWSQSFSFTWGQDTCTPGPVQGCPGPQVPAGQYQVTGQSGGGSSQIPAGTPVTITID